MSIKKVLVMLLALTMVLFAACSDDDSTSGGPTITLDPAIVTSAGVLMTNGQVTCLGDDGAWDQTAGDPIDGVAIVADPAGSDKAYVFLAPAMIEQSKQSVFMTNDGITQATWATGWAMEAVNGASTTVAAGWFNDYKPFCIGELGNAYHDAADLIGGFYSASALLMRKLSVQINGNDVYVATISKARSVAAIGDWGESSRFDFKFGFQSRGDSAAVDSGSTVGYVFAPSSNFGCDSVDIPDWDKVGVLTVVSTTPANNAVVAPGSAIAINFFSAVTNVTVDGAIPAGIAFTIENVTDGTSIENDGSNIGVEITDAGKTLTITNDYLAADKTYNISFNGFVGTNAIVMDAAYTITNFSVAPYRDVVLMVDTTLVTDPAWGATANLHLFDGAFEVTPGAWPGLAMDDLGSGVFSNQISVAGGFSLIFNNNAGSQTADIVVDGDFNGGTYVINNTNTQNSMTGTW